MPLNKAAQAAKNLIERGQKEQLDQGLPGDRIKNQLPSRALPPASGTTRGAVALGDTDPEPLGVADAGASAAVSRADHVHPASGGSGTITITDSTTTVSGVTLLTLDGATIDDDAGGAATLTVVVGSGAWRGLPLDEPPAIPHAKDDEFDGTSLDGKWTQPISSGTGLGVTITVIHGALYFEPTTSGSSSTGKRGGYGVRQNAPTGSFTVMAKVTDVPGVNGAVGDARAGVFVADSAGKAHVCGWQTSAARSADCIGATYSESAEWSTYDGFNSFTGTLAPAVGEWYKIQWDSGSTTLTFSYSMDGCAWRVLDTRSGQTQPDRLGLALYVNGADMRADHQLCCQWLRVTEP